MQLPEELLKKIHAINKKNNTLFIAIDGRGGSGKSTLADMLKKQLQGSEIIRLDDINYPFSESDRKKVEQEILIPSMNNQIGKYQVYDYKNKKMGENREIQPGNVIIIEGVSILHNDLSSYFDFKIWVECSPEIGFKRGVARELKLTGKDVTEVWLQYMKEEEKYIEEQKPQERADYIMFTE